LSRQNKREASTSPENPLPAVEKWVRHKRVKYSIESYMDVKYVGFNPFYSSF